MKKVYSLRKLFFLVIFVTLLLLSITAVTYCVTSFSSYSDQVLEKNAMSLNKYADSLERELDSIQQRIRGMVYNDTNFMLLTLASYPDSKKIPVNYNIQELIRTFTPPYAITLLYDGKTNRSFFYNGSAFQSNDLLFTSERLQIQEFRENVLLPELCPQDTWFVYNLGEDPYLCYFSGNNGAYVGSFVSLSRYGALEIFPSDTAESSVIISSGDVMLSYGGAVQEKEISLSDIRTDSQEVESVFQKGSLIQRVSLPAHNLSISVITPFRELLRKILPQIIFAVVMVVLTVVIILLMGFVMRRMLLFPLQEIALFSNSLEDGGELHLPSEHSSIREYNEIRTSLVQLLDKQAELEQERLTKEQAREHAALQYYQLQTRSHFFLNCLKSLYNMSENNQIPKMQAMILAFSNHLRYIFHDNLMTVPMESELREVSDYHRIILLDYSRIFILTQNVPTEFMNVQVPPLLVQTFLENTYKYNSKTGEPLVFEVSAKREEIDGTAFMKLTLSDNGNGYSEEVLERINEELTGSYDQFNVGINNLRRRLAILYRGRCRTEFMNKPEGGACALIYIPLDAEISAEEGEL
ncbi:MAG: histidine kinase [Lachnospiraceae bacterium]|nr:histidine kinase [Lachnospiraceae bacterium]